MVVVNIGQQQFTTLDMLKASSIYYDRLKIYIRINSFALTNIAVFIFMLIIVKITFMA